MMCIQKAMIGLRATVYVDIEVPYALKEAIKKLDEMDINMLLSMALVQKQGDIMDWKDAAIVSIIDIEMEEE